MRSYEGGPHASAEFIQSIRMAFSSLIEKYTLQFFEGTSLGNEFCRISCSFDRGQVACFVGPREKRDQSAEIKMMTNFHYPDQKLFSQMDHIGVWPDAQEQLTSYAAEIERHYSALFLGDFTLLAKYLKNKKNIQKKQI